MMQLVCFRQKVAARLFVFAGIYIHAFDLLSLEKTYVCDLHKTTSQRV